MTAHSIYEIIHDDHKMPIKEAITKVYDTGEQQSLDCLAYSNDDELVWYSIRIAAIRKGNDDSDDEIGTILYAIIFATDISENKKYENRLVKSEARLAEAQRIAHLGSWEHIFADGQVHWSDELFYILDYKVNEVVPSTDALIDAVHEDNREMVANFISLAIKKGKPFEVEFKVQTKNEELRFIHANAEIIFDGDGKPNKLIGTAQDVTELILANSALKDSEGRFDLAVLGANDGIWDIDFQNDTRYYSPRLKYLLGFEEDDNFEIENLIHPEDMENYQTAMDHHIDEHEPFSIELRLQHKTNDYLWFQIRGQAVWERNGKATRMAGSIRDISNSRKMEQRIRTSNKMEALGNLAGVIAHDFNNLLAGITSCADLIKLKSSESNSHTKYTDEILKMTSRAADLTKQLLAFSRKKNLHKEPIDIHEMINEVATILTRTIDKRIQIETELLAPESLISGDTSQIQSAILNLGINAKDSMPEGGMLKFITEIEERESIEYIKILVTDTGKGIPPENLDRIFEPFFTDKEIGQGTGLGLAAVYGTAESHNGEVSVKSALGVGSCFVMSLPLSKQLGIEVALEDRIVNGSGCVLLVDDEDVIRSVCGDILEELGYEVITAEDGEDAITKYRSYSDKIDLVILDMMMPKLNGRQTFQTLRGINPEIKVLISSGYNDDQELADILQKNNTGTLQKPYKITDLSSKINELLVISK